MNVEILHNDKFEVIRTNGVWNVLDGGRFLFVTFPCSYDESYLENIKSCYEKNQVTYYRSRKNKRYVMVINNTDIEKIEKTLNKIF
jgi:hypothetical protein